jgi:hypothetical protein
VKTAGLLSRRMHVVGWLCALGIGLMIFDLVRFLPELPQHWWSPEKPPQLVGNGLQFDLRVMRADLGLAWLGQWGYLGALMWLPCASVRVWRATRAGRRASPSERILFATLCVLLVAISGLVHFTPLRYPTFNFFVI